MSLDFEALLTELGLQATPRRSENMSPPFSKQTEKTYQTRTPDSTSKKVRLVLNVNLKDGIVEQLIIYNQDDPQQKVKEFCSKHSLDKAAQNVLLKQISVNTEHSFSAAKPVHSNYNSSNKKTQKNYFSTENVQPGERLYNLAQLRQKQKETFVKKLKEEKQQVELEQCKQVPEISRNTNIILNRMGYKKGFMKDKKGLQNYEQMYHQEQDKECTFQPKINEISKQMSLFARERSSQYNVFDELYEKAKTRNYAQPEQENVECTFQPVITSQSQLSNLLSDDFLVRMEKAMEQRREKLEEIKLKYEHIDLRTQQLLYKPKIGRSPKNRTAYEKLYQQSFKQQARLKELQERRKAEQQFESVPKNQYSQDLVFQQRKNALRTYFEQMDHDGDGLVSCTKEELQKLSNTAVQILLPVLQDIAEMHEKIDFEDFFECCYGFVMKLPQCEKDELFIQRSKSSWEQQPSFTPKINDRSRQLCSRQRQYPTCNCETCQGTEEVRRQLEQS